jgi:hypothetical protein
MGDSAFWKVDTDHSFFKHSKLEFDIPLTAIDTNVLGCYDGDVLGATWLESDQAVFDNGDFTHNYGLDDKGLIRLSFPNRSVHRIFSYRISDVTRNLRDGGQGDDNLKKDSDQTVNSADLLFPAQADAASAKDVLLKIISDAQKLFGNREQASPSVVAE